MSLVKQMYQTFVLASNRDAIPARGLRPRRTPAGPAEAGHHIRAETSKTDADAGTGAAERNCWIREQGVLAKLGVEVPPLADVVDDARANFQQCLGRRAAESGPQDDAE